MFGPSLLCHGSRADTFHSSHCLCFQRLCCAAFLLRHSSNNPKPSATDTQGFYFGGCWSTTQQFRTEQIKQDRHSDTDTVLKHAVHCQNKHSVLTPDHISLNFINKTSLCEEPGLKSTDQRFSEAAITRDSEINAKSPAVWRCCALKRSRWGLTDNRAGPQQSRPRAHTQPAESRGNK